MIQDERTGALSTSPNQFVCYGICPYDSNSMKSGNPDSGVFITDKAKTLDRNCCNPACNQGGVAICFAKVHAPLTAADGEKGVHSQMMKNPEENFVLDPVAIEGNGARPSHKGCGYSEDGKSFTLNTIEQHGVAYGLDRASYNQGKNAKYDFTIEEEEEPTLTARGPGAVAHPVNSSGNDVAETIDGHYYSGCEARGGKEREFVGVKEDTEYIVRRLIPTECARLQGFPDWWCSSLETENPTEEDLEFWREVFKTYADATGGKPKTDNQIIKWLKNPHSDAAEYKMWGNGIALPCVYYIMESIVQVMGDIENV